MPAETNIYSLSDIARNIRKTLAERYADAYWISAEMNKLNYYSQSGHCFPELLEKHDGKVVAQMRSTLWREDYRRINDKFLDVLGEPLADGIKILFLGRVSFDPVYGLALRIIDIDPKFTLGDLEKEKKETIKKLLDEGIFHNNSKCRFPLLPKRIAILSVETSKGYVDFIEVIDNNPWKYRFTYLLFPSVLQGDKAAETIVYQLNRIRKVSQHFDLVAIIRGGGGDIGLAGFNHYSLAKAVAEFPIPVLTGIGHATNETVTEMVAYYNAITPTKLGEYLIQKFHNFSVPVQEAENMLKSFPRALLKKENESLWLSSRKIHRATINVFGLAKSRVHNLISLFRRESFHTIKKHQNSIGQGSRQLTSNCLIALNRNSYLLTDASGRIASASERFLKMQNTNIQNLGQQARNMDPARVLRRGYSITTLNGRALQSDEGITPGNIIHTRLFKGSLISIVQAKNKE